jgi:tRNA(Ile)-lysidine synthase
LARPEQPLPLQLADRLGRILPELSVGQGDAGSIAVAFSGGRDSTALLHAAWRLASERGFALHALHIHHGLSPLADGWVAKCRAQCLRWSRRGAPIRFHLRRLALDCAPGDSVEALAREGRYAALTAMAKELDCPVVLLAQHANDQAETFLLQALRGAGAAGLAAMPPLQRRDGLLWLRPWLDRPRAEIEAYLRRHRLTYVDDDSNAQPRYARNRLRLTVWPALEAAFPQALTVLAAAARHAQDASECLDALADLDLSRVRDSGPDGAHDPAALRLDRLLELGGARRRNLLRRWLREAGLPVSAALLQRLADELPLDEPAAAGGKALSWALPGGWTLRAWRGRLMRVAPAPPPGPAQPFWLQIDGPGRYALPDWAGWLQVECSAAAGAGIALARLRRVLVGSRTGGEQFQRAPGTPPRALKKQFQAAAVPAWLRRGPLLFDETGALLFVPGLGVDARCIAAPEAGDPVVQLAWVTQPDAALQPGDERSADPPG